MISKSLPRSTSAVDLTGFQFAGFDHLLGQALLLPQRCFSWFGNLPTAEIPG